MDARSVVRGVWPVAAAAGLGSLATVKGVRSDWYRSLRQPAIQPPPPVFRWVWSGLYTAVAAGSVVADAKDPTSRFHAALLRNMGLNTAWTWVFFRGHSARGGVVVATALAADSVSLARRAARISRPAGAAIAPYAAWTCFAVTLNAAIIAKNPVHPSTRATPRRLGHQRASRRRASPGRRTAQVPHATPRHRRWSHAIALVE